MYFAIIESSSDVSVLTTIAYGAKIADLAHWYADEVRECIEMYASDEQSDDEKSAMDRCDELCELADEDALDISDLSGIITGADEVSVEIIAIYDGFEDFCDAFTKYVSAKPKFKKITPDANASDIIAECDRINSLLIKECV